MLRPEMHHIFRTRRSTNLKLGMQMEFEDPYHRQAPLLPRSKVKVARLHGPSDSCKSSSKSPENTKNGRMVVHLLCDKAH